MSFSNNVNDSCISTHHMKPLQSSTSSNCNNLYHLISSSTLYLEIKDNCTRNLLILDVRTFHERSKCYIKGSIHTCLPSMLLKRKNFTFENLIDTLPLFEQNIVRQKLFLNNLKIIIYGDTNINLNDNNIACYGIANKLANYNTSKDYNISILKDGFIKFKEEYPSLIQYNEFNDSSSSLNSSDDEPSQTSSETSSNTSISPVLPVFCKFSLPSHDDKGMTFSLARKDETLSIESYLSAVNNKEKTSLHIPTDCKDEYSLSDKLRCQLRYSKMVKLYSICEINAIIPHWFQALMNKNKVEIVSQFQKLDVLERKRLNISLTSHHKHSLSLDSSEYNNQLSQPSRRSVSFSSTEQPDADWLCILNLPLNKQKFIQKGINKNEITPQIERFEPSGFELGFKNRYKDILPYEHTRVALCGQFKNSQRELYSDDYINANYLSLPELPANIPAQSIPIRYIATQAPMKTTIEDFFQCIMNDRVPIIITLTDEFENKREKCYKYWINREYEHYSVQVIQEETLRVPNEVQHNVILRILQISSKNQIGKSSILLQIHVKNWADGDILSDPMIIINTIELKEFVLKKLAENNVLGQHPTILVHCSAGCGRTGTWCTIDNIISNLKTFNTLEKKNEAYIKECGEIYDPISWTINIFRKQRVYFVQNVKQFIFIYECLLSYFILKLCDLRQSEKGNCLALIKKSISDIQLVNKYLNLKFNEQK